MFKKYYKEANDDIETNRELIDKIFEKADMHKKMSGTVIYKYSMAVAAVFVIAASAYSYPKLVQYSNVETRDMVETENIKHKALDTQKEQYIEENTNISSATTDKTEKNINVEISSDKTTLKTDIPAENTISESNISGNTVANSPEIAMVDIPAEVIDDEKASRNTRLYTEDKGETVVWSSEKYCEYLGVDIRSLLAIPSDLKDTTGNVFYIIMKDGEIESDLATFSFAGENERKVFIETSKKTEMKYDDSEAVDYFENEIYFKYKDINIKINSFGLSHDEISKMVESITED